MAYEVPPLHYAYDALEPHIDKATMEFHHDKHHQAYVDKVNAALEGTPLDGKPIEEVLADGEAADEADHAGGHDETGVDVVLEEVVEPRGKAEGHVRGVREQRGAGQCPEGLNPCSEPG